MTMPYERFAALRNTYDFLHRIFTRGIRGVTNEEIAKLLRHYPDATELRQIAKCAPDWLQEPPAYTQ